MTSPLKETATARETAKEDKKRPLEEEKKKPVVAEKRAKKEHSPMLTSVIEAIRGLKSHCGSSVKAIIKEMKSKTPQEVDEAQVKAIVKESVAAGVLIKQKASFLVAGDPVYEDLSDKVTITELELGLDGGKQVKKGDIIKIKYRGTLAATGVEFDKGDLKFQVFGGEVVKGFDHSVIGMKVAGKRRCLIPFSLGYGKRGSPPEIPPNADLVFEIELISVA